MATANKNIATTQTDRTLVEKLVRKDVLNMVPYQSARREQSGGSCWLNANEAGGENNLDVSLTNLNRYPDFQPQALITSYAQYAGVSNEQVLATRGADEGIEVLIRTFCTASKDNIVICPPTYGMYAISAAGHDVAVNIVPLTDELQLDLAALKQQNDAKIVFICSPNNPTGDVINRNDIIATLEHFKEQAIVVVDEAYIEYCPQLSVVNLLNEYPNLVVFRTLSKAFALAGLRCGFTLASKEIIAMMSKIIAPYPISNPVAHIAIQALSAQGLEIMQTRVANTIVLRADTIEFLQKQSWLESCFSSVTNYVLFKANNAPQLFNYLINCGVLIRNQSKQLTLENCLRISIGTAAELNQFKQAVNQYNKELKEQP